MGFKRILAACVSLAFAGFADFKKKAMMFGFKVEELSFYTKDDYKLVVVKVFAKPSRSPQKPILLMHGLGMNADSWIMHAEEANESLPLILAGMGHEVFIGNFRGTSDYSFHKFFDKSQKEFWDIKV